MSAIQPLFPLINPMPKATANAPIGIFDSGIGGLSIAQEIAKHLPHERFIYFADTAHVPYGPRDDQNIRELTAQAIEWLYRKGCKVAVVACNTASAFSLDYLREHYGDNFPIIGLVPALKPAVLQSKSKTVAVLATPATFRGQLIKDVVDKFAQPSGVTVIPVTCLDLVPFVESGAQMSAACLATLKDILQPVVDQGADYLVLGCTTARILIKNELLFEQNHDGDVRIECYVSGNNAESLRPILQLLLEPELNWTISNISD